MSASTSNWESRAWSMPPFFPWGPSLHLPTRPPGQLQLQLQQTPRQLLGWVFVAHTLKLSLHSRRPSTRSQDPVQAVPSLPSRCQATRETPSCRCSPSMAAQTPALNPSCCLLLGSHICKNVPGSRFQSKTLVMLQCHMSSPRWRVNLTSRCLSWHKAGHRSGPQPLCVFMTCL